MKLDQIPKKNPFNAPQGYFDKLPGMVQSRIEAQQPVRRARPYVSFALRYALPVVVMLAAGIFWFRSGNSGHIEFETELAGIDVRNLEVYLEVIDTGADELVETTDPMAIGWSADELHALENSIYESYDLPDSELNELLDVYEVEPVKDSVQ